MIVHACSQPCKFYQPLLAVWPSGKLGLLASNDRRTPFPSQVSHVRCGHRHVERVHWIGSEKSEQHRLDSGLDEIRNARQPMASSRSNDQQTEWHGCLRLATDIRRCGGQEFPRWHRPGRHLPQSIGMSSESCLRLRTDALRLSTGARCELGPTASDQHLVLRQSRSYLVDFARLLRNGHPRQCSVRTKTLLSSASLALSFPNRLRSRSYTSVGDECFRFWYFVNGPSGSTGKLTVSKQNGNTQAETVQWSTDIYENAWRYGQVTIKGDTSSFIALFQASKSSADVVIGVDDVIMTLGYCPPPINCDFERADICSWTQMKDDDFDWLLIQGETDSFDTGPSVGKRSMKT